MLRNRGPLCLLIAPLAMSLIAACGPDRRTDPSPDVAFDVLPDADVTPDITPDITPDVDAAPDIGPDADVSPDAPDAAPDVEPDAPGPACGDGIRDPGEACDDGNTTSGDGCSETCTVESCGDGFVSTGLGEECDSGAEFTMTCRDLGLGDGDLACLDDLCRFDVRDCQRGRCGDGEVTGDEGCDDGNVLDGDGCSSICFVETCLASNADCAGADELCDGIDNDGDGWVDDHPVDPGLGDPCDAGCGDGVLACVAGRIECVGTAPVDPPLCNGRDDECTGADDACEAVVDAGSTLVRDVEIGAPDVDLLLLIDGSPSMAESRAYLGTRLADGWWPSGAARVAIATVGDVPVAPFGAPTDRPWTLHRRAANLVVHADTLAETLAASSVSRAGDPGLAAWPALVHAADGEGFAWPGRPRDVAPVPSALVPIRDGADARFEVDVRAGQRVEIEVVSARAGEALDAILELYAPGADTPFARNDDRFATDPALEVIAPSDGALGIRVLPCCGGDDRTLTEGWAGVRVRVDGIPHVPGRPWGTCADPAPGATDGPPRGALVDVRTVWPRPVDTCTRDCLGEGAPARLVRDFCGDGRPIGRCGNGRIDSGETCDDGDFVVGDGCGADCQLEVDRVAPFDPVPGYVPALGHGDLGGFGFRAGARPVVAWVTDSPAHDDAVWAEIGAELPGALDAADALRAAGVVPIVVDPSLETIARDTYAPWALRAGGSTDVCAWGAERSCPDDRCCDGTDLGTAPTDGLCPLAVGGDGASLGAHIESALRAAVHAPLDLDLAIESDVDGAACLIDALFVRTEAGCGPGAEVDLDAGRLAGVRAEARIELRVETSNRDTRDIDGDENRTEPCLRAADVPVRIVARDAAGAVYIDEPFVIHVE